MDHGDASRTSNGQRPWSFILGTCVRPVCYSHCVYPSGNGGSVCVPACYPAALVRYQ